MSAPMIRLDSKYILNKPVITSDGYMRGHIVGQTDNELVLMEGTWRVRRYNIPKSLVTNFDGSYIYLSIPDKEMEKYRVK